ncbi:MAG: hypothetical protein RBS99_06445 [Rhodospirillales bacterium]|jgi:uncharacterized protein (DUF433 family)|nr:hypothetical protein [Rhodospirillales bacterium]
MNQEIQVDWSNVDSIGLYTVPMAARLIGANQTKLRSWIDGYGHSDAKPIIHRQPPRMGGKTALGFLDLIEARFIRHFNTWFSPQTIRRVATKLRARHDIEHPFAMNSRFRTDGKSIFMESTDDENERRVLNLMNDNFVMEPVIERSLFDSIFYVEDIARAWRPFFETPRVIVDPRFAFGRPVIDDIWIPTETLMNAFMIEGSAMAAAEEYDVDEDAIIQAVHFERSLDEKTVH